MNVHTQSRTDPFVCTCVWIAAMWQKMCLISLVIWIRWLGL